MAQGGLVAIREARAVVLQRYIRAQDLPRAAQFVAYQRMPQKGTALVLPYDYCVVAGAKPYTPDGSGINNMRSRGEASIHFREYRLGCATLIGEMADPAGLARLDTLLEPWLDPIWDAYMANLKLNFTCSEVVVEQFAPYYDRLLGTKHYGWSYTLIVRSAKPTRVANNTEV